MKKSLQKLLDKSNKELKDRNFLKNYEIEIDGNFTTEYNFIRLRNGARCFPIATVKTEDEAIAAINAYLSGFAHGTDKSYVRHCDKEC